MKKKLVALLTATAMSVMALTGCGDAAAEPAAQATEAAEAAAETEAAQTEAAQTEAASDIKVGVIYIGDENEGYTAAHMAGIEAMKAALGLSDDQVIAKTNIGEDENCYDAAVDLADQGCKIVFANSFGHEDYLLRAAAEYPDVQFAHATGYQATSSGLSNMHNYFTAVYESRYVSGVVAGLKLNEMIESGKITADAAKVGYVGAYPYAEVISGFTSFFLGVRSIVPTATMEVQYTSSWADMTAENEVATALIADGCVLISQHADTTGAPTACEAAGVPCVGYNVDMTSVAPTCALTSASINWGPYYTYAVQSVMNGESFDTDWCRGYEEDADKITPLNDAAIAEGTAEKVAEVEAAIKDGSLHVFDTTTFTVAGKSLEDAIADGTVDASYASYVSDGYFHESELASAPAFALIIDGITELTE
ncbi:MAG: BMP family ABC transporter substrate-binding protein [Lachnospiraceae bacterium]|nr:BMP family ABC transporter substrate-binding protein [Lachnospiraceae bacterium]